VGALHSTAASLRFTGDLDPDEVSSKLGAKPSTSARKGAIRQTPKGREFIARSGIWILKADQVSPGDLDGQINTLLAGLSEDLAVWQDIARRYNGHILAGLFLGSANEGMGVASKTLVTLGARGLALECDIYGPADEE
jgi:hypothetical protein